MTPPALRAQLFRELDLRIDGVPLPPLESGRAESLLAYLLLHRAAPQPREHLAYLLWPDSPESQARTNLRHVLHNLRRAIPLLDQMLVATARTLQWHPDAPLWLDVTAFEELLQRAGEATTAAGLAALREAVALYSGDLLAGKYDEWLRDERERLRLRYLDALDLLASRLETAGERGEAVRYAELLVRHDPLREEAYRRLMRLHDAGGDRARALRVYHACAATLERELGVEPAAATRDVYEALLPATEEARAVERGATPVGAAPLVGRTDERAQLTALWRAAERGRAHFVLLRGEPGVGKTRLVEALRSWSLQRGATVAEARSFAAEGALAYGPVIAWLRTEALRARLPHLDRVYLTELARLLPEIAAADPTLPRPETLAEHDQRQRLFDAVVGALLLGGEPLLLIADDIHWCDRETPPLIHYLLRVAADAPLLVVATARSDELDPRHPVSELVTGLRLLERCTEITIGRLSRGETALLAERVTGRALPDPDGDRLYAETEGNPLFVVEALRAGWTGRAHEPGRLSPRVQAVIESRLERLSAPARDLVGIAATIGREFSTEVLAQASEAGEDDLVRGLDELWRRHIIREHGADAYDFSHDKIREVAYLGLSPVRRRHYHLRVALALERLRTQDPDSISGQLAAHYERGGAIEPALTWYIRAGEVAKRLYANAEAMRLLGRALDLVRTLPPGPSRDTRELAILTELPASIGSVEGFASDRLTAVHERALALSHALAVEVAPSFLRSLAVACLSHADFDAAQRFGEQLRERGTRTADDVLIVEAGYVLGIAAYWQGHFAEARRHFETAVARYRPEHSRIHALHYTFDPKVICLSRLANTLWFLGYPLAAVRTRDATLVLAEEVGNPFSHEIALVFAALLAMELGEIDGVRSCTDALHDAVTRRSLGPSRITIGAFAGYLDVIDGHTDTGIARIKAAIAETGGADPAPGMRGALIRLLMEAYGATGDARAGLAAAEQALRLGRAAGLYASEAHRHRAECLAALGCPEREVEAAFRQALDLAAAQGAISLELRAAAGLLRRRQQRGDEPGAAAAHAALAALLDRLPERAPGASAAAAALLIDRRLHPLPGNAPGNAEGTMHSR